MRTEVHVIRKNRFTKAMMNGLLTNVYNLNEEYLLELRSDAVYNVKKTNGQLSLEQHAEKKYEDDEWQS